MDLYVKGMHGMGDNLHQRALVRHLLEAQNRVFLETPWPSVYTDLVGFYRDRLHLVDKGSTLRTQAKNARREAALYSSEPVPTDARQVRVWYSPEMVRRKRSVLGAMLEQSGYGVAKPDFRMPVPATWLAAADRFLEVLKPDKPVMLFRPLVERTEWSGCRSRNPDFGAWQQLFEAVRDRFFVISVADLVEGKEWAVGPRLYGDAEFHRGELPFHTLAGLAQRAGLVWSSPGFAVILAQAVGTPSVCMFGGYEGGYSFSLGAKLTPHLSIAPIRSCDCFRHDHPCNKKIDLLASRSRLEAFLEEPAAALAPA